MRLMIRWVGFGRLFGPRVSLGRYLRTRVRKLTVAGTTTATTETVAPDPLLAVGLIRAVSIKLSQKRGHHPELVER
jgi:hypothetical protein